ncbi:MAG: extracellular solute-binding protein [Anaerolineae bacterium]|nr:extracellular solute-binding protein [Anaerolineae bacterium]
MHATRILFGALIILSLAAFIMPPPGESLPTAQQPQPTATPSPTLEASPTAPPAMPGTPRPDLVVWWPAELMPAAESAAGDALLTVLETYRTENDLSLQLRVKRLTGTGSIMSTLRTASHVAPAALPDVALLSRATLVGAIASATIYPLDDMTAAELTREVYPRAVPLGQVEDRFYGVPLALIVQHAAYRENDFERSPDTFRAVLESGQPFAFAAGKEIGTSDALLIQYTEAGGRLISDEGRPTLDAPALEDVLNFYAGALDSEQITPDLLDSTTPLDTWNALITGNVSLAQVDSSTYIRQHSDHGGILPTILPTEGGGALTTLEGWLWVITTSDPERQAAAIAFITWMMEPEQQATITETLQILPSRPQSLQSRFDPAYSALIDRLLSSSRAVLTERVTTTTATALQEALVSVIREERSPEEAASAAAERVNR